MSSDRAANSKMIKDTHAKSQKKVHKFQNVKKFHAGYYAGDRIKKDKHAAECERIL